MNDKSNILNHSKRNSFFFFFGWIASNWFSFVKCCWLLIEWMWGTLIRRVVYTHRFLFCLFVAFLCLRFFNCNLVLVRELYGEIEFNHLGFGDTFLVFGGRAKWNDCRDWFLRTFFLLDFDGKRLNWRSFLWSRHILPEREWFFRGIF